LPPPSPLVARQPVRVVAVRPLRDRDTGASRGCAFLELSDAAGARHLVRRGWLSVGRRRAKVEVTCGGGGKGDRRVRQLRMINENAVRRRKGVAKKQ
jgi:hypothetical protein